MLGYKRGGAGYALIKVHSLSESGTGKTGVDNKEIMLDTSFEPQRRAKTSGTVIQLPLYMGNMPIIQIPDGFPGYGAQRTFADDDMEDPSPALYTTGNVRFRMMADIAQEVQIGDTIHFKWRVLYGRNNMVAESISKDAATPSTWIFRVPYDHIYCAVRDGSIIPIGSHVLIDPIFETWDEILRPTYYEFKNALGEFIPRPKDQWIQTKVAPAKKDRQGIVAHVGTPLAGEQREIEPGDKVLFRPNLKNLVKIEGKSYFVLRQSQITCKFI